MSLESALQAALDSSRLDLKERLDALNDQVASNSGIDIQALTIAAITDWNKGALSPVMAELDGKLEAIAAAYNTHKHPPDGTPDQEIEL